MDKEFKIYQITPFGRTFIAKWEAASADDAVREFLEFNPAYKKRGALEARFDEAVKDDIVKEGTHGKFATKKEAAAQTRAMYANGYKGDSVMDARWEVGKRVRYEGEYYIVNYSRGEWILEPEDGGSQVRVSDSIMDATILPAEGHSMDGIPYGKYVYNGKPYKAFEIVSSDNGLRKGMYRFYNWGSRSLAFGNAAVDGQMSFENFDRCVAEGKIRLLDADVDYGLDVDKVDGNYERVEATRTVEDAKQNYSVAVRVDGKTNIYVVNASSPAQAAQAVYKEHPNGNIVNIDGTMTIQNLNPVIFADDDFVCGCSEEDYMRDSELEILKRSGDNALIYRANADTTEPYVYARNFNGYEWGNGTYFKSKEEALKYWESEQERIDKEKKDCKTFHVKDSRTGKTYSVRANDSLSAVKKVSEVVRDNLGDDVKKYQEWVDYDMKRYGKISDKTNEELRKAGLKVVKDKYGDYEVIV